MLRGTSRKQQRAAFNQRPTLQNQITALKAQVSRNKPETQYYRVSGSYSAPSAGIKITNIPITTDLIGSSSFRDNVTGDKWRNLMTKFKLTVGSSNIGAIRVLCYVPKTAGDRFAPASNEFTEFPDPSAFWVLSDDLLQKPNDDANTSKVYSKAYNYKGMHTLYNSNAASLEKGECVITVIVQAAGAGTVYQYGFMHTYQNI